MPVFNHVFEPSSATQLGATVSLSTRQIEDAGLLEVLQSPGAALGTWAILDALLDGGQKFRFREPLGKSREVKTAMSGLFGRFVARAYAKRYLRYSHFAHIHSPPMHLDGVHRAEVRRVRGRRGDLPDWAAWAPGMRLAVIEAKGCHDKSGPAKRAEKAFRQAERAEIRISGRLASFKRYAIATRWGIATVNPTDTMIHVIDPVVEGDVTAEELKAAGIGVAKRHMASLLRSVGHVELSAALVETIRPTFRNRREEAERRARALLDSAIVYEVDGSDVHSPLDGLVGGVVTRGGPIVARSRLSFEDQETLTRLELRPTFVGIERQAIEAVLEGNIQPLDDDHVAEILVDTGADGDGPTSDGGGGWIVRLEQDRARLR